MMRYKGYVGVMRVDTDAGVLRGRVVNTRDMITFQGKSVEDAVREFHASVDDYLAFCAERGVQPERPFSGNFPVRTTPALHRKLFVAAGRQGLSLNAFVERALTRAARTASRKATTGAALRARKSGDGRVVKTTQVPDSEKIPIPPSQRTGRGKKRLA